MKYGSFVALLCWAVTVAAQSPAERRIAAAARALSASPSRYELHNELALALARRARETGDPGFYLRAEEALKESLRIAPGNFEGQKVKVWVLLGKHEFSQALELARELNRQMPDDVQVYGMLADAYAELGQYEEAEKAVQWMLDLRPGNVAALTRGAYLRELFGDLEGALDFMQAALQRLPGGETEDRAWILTQLAHLSRLAGRHEIAARLAGRALQLMPGYHYALGELARICTAQGKHEEAVMLLRQRYRAAPHPENLYELAMALERAGELLEAQEAFVRFEQEARRESVTADNANRELVFYYADRAGDPPLALRLADEEMQRGRDVHTRHAYAWALFRNGRVAEAAREIETVLAVGVRDPSILEHAAAIRGAGSGGLMGGAAKGARNLPQ
ncbi:MAG TPA: tetratricopeptide repeat protein [Bryobacteraceae bacterium]|nr:tetratricopeptide repeat protein [Bryobacteraceae bacterium]